METTWDLSVYYTGFDDPALAADLAALATMAEDGMAVLKKETDAQDKAYGDGNVSGGLHQ